MYIFNHLLLSNLSDCVCETKIKFETRKDKKTFLERAVNIMKFHPDHYEEKKEFWRARQVVSTFTALGGMVVALGGCLAYKYTVTNTWFSLASIILGLGVLFIYAGQAKVALKKLEQLDKEKVATEWHKTEEYLVAHQQRIEGQIDMGEVWKSHCVKFFQEMKKLFDMKHQTPAHGSIPKFINYNPLREEISGNLTKKNFDSLNDDGLWIEDAIKRFQAFTKLKTEIIDKNKKTPHQIPRQMYLPIKDCINDIVNLFPKGEPKKTESPLHED